MAHRPVVRNVTILAVTGVIERGLGMIYRIVLARAAGPVALGLIQLCLPVLRMSFILATLGLPQALTRIVADANARGRPDEAENAVSYALWIVGSAAGIIALFLLFMAPVVRGIFPDPRVEPLFKWLALVLICDSIGTILQADRQGRNLMWPVAAARLVGQCSKLALSLVLIGQAVQGGADAVAIAAMISLVGSELITLLFLFGLSGRLRPAKRHAGSAYPGLISSSLPLMGDSIVFAVAGAIDMIVIPGRLAAAGLPGEAVTSLVGQVWGMCFPTIFLPMVLVWPITAAVLPVLTTAQAKGDLDDMKRRISQTYAAVGVIAVLASIVLLFRADFFMKVIYGSTVAAPYLRSLAWAILPIYLASIGSTFLVALGKPGLLFRQSLVCASLRTFLLYFLTGFRGLGVNGAILGIALGNAALAVINGWSVWNCLRSPRVLTRSIGRLRA